MAKKTPGRRFDFAEAKEVRKLLTNESDVGGVLIATSYIDACLEKILRSQLIDSRVSDKLLKSGTGALGTFSCRADLCYCLGILSKDTYNELIKIAEIRNIFSHNHLSANFKNNEVEKCCRELKSPDRYIEGNEEQSNIEDVIDHYEQPKNRFVYTVLRLIDLLSKKVISQGTKDGQNSKNV